MEQHSGQPITVQQSVDATKIEMLALLKRHDPIWRKKFENLVSNVEVLAFRSGFMWGAIACALACVVVLLVARP